MKHKLKFILLSFCIFFSMQIIGVSAFMPFRPPVAVSNERELLHAYQEKKSDIYLTDSIEIYGNITLSPEDHMTISTRDSINDTHSQIIVKNGGSLTLDSSFVEIYYPKFTTEKYVSIYVENGGTLNLKQGMCDYIYLEKNAVFHHDDTFNIEKEHIMKEAEPDPAVPEQEVSNVTLWGQTSINYIMGDDFQIQNLPQSATVFIDGNDIKTYEMETNITWDISSVNFHKAGEYDIIGTIDMTQLEKDNIYIKDKFKTLHFQIIVNTKGPVTSLKGYFQKDNQAVLLQLPLIDDANCIYLYTSEDKQIWNKATWDELIITEDDTSLRKNDNFINIMNNVQAFSYINYHLPQIAEKPLYLKVDIVGGTYEGLSNILYITLNSLEKPFQNDSSGGNRGGGGQTETNRDDSNPEAAKAGMKTENASNNTSSTKKATKKNAAKSKTQEINAKTKDKKSTQSSKTNIHTSYANSIVIIIICVSILAIICCLLYIFKKMIHK